MSQFQLPCEQCQHVIPISVTMAGSSVTCPKCGNVQTVPKMGTIRNLAPMVGSTGKKTARFEWSPTQGLLFGLGFILLVCGLLGVGFTYPNYAKFEAEYNQLIATMPEQRLPEFAKLEIWENSISQLPIEVLWDEWRQALRTSIGDWNPNSMRRILDDWEHVSYYLYSFAATAAIGMLLIGASRFKWGR